MIPVLEYIFGIDEGDSAALVSLIRRGQSLRRAYNRGVLCVRSLILGGIAYSIPSRFRRRRFEEG